MLMGNRTRHTGGAGGMTGTAALASHARSEQGPVPGAPWCGQWGLVCALGRRCCGLTGRGGTGGRVASPAGVELSKSLVPGGLGMERTATRCSALGWQWPVGLEVGRQVAGEGCT